MEELLQGSAQGQQRLGTAERRTVDEVGERSAKRVRVQLADRRADAARSSADAVLPLALTEPDPVKNTAKRSKRRDGAWKNRTQGWSSQAPAMPRKSPPASRGTLD